MSHLETDLKGAEFWLKYVLSEQQSHRAKQKEAENWLKEEMVNETITKTKNGGKGRKR